MIMQFVYLEKYRDHMHDDNGRNGIVVLIIGFIIVSVTGVVALFTGQEGLKAVMSQTTMEGLL